MIIMYFPAEDQIIIMNVEIYFAVSNGTNKYLEGKKSQIKMQQTIISSKLNLLLPKAFAPSIKHNPFYHYSGSHSPNRSPNRKHSISLCEKKHLKNLCEKISTIKKVIPQKNYITQQNHKERNFNSVSDLWVKHDSRFCNFNKSHLCSSFELNQQKNIYTKSKLSRKMITEPVSYAQNQKLNDTLLTKYKQFRSKYKQKECKSLGPKFMYEKYKTSINSKSQSQEQKIQQQIQENWKIKIFPLPKFNSEGLKIKTIYENLEPGKNIFLPKKVQNQNRYRKRSVTWKIQKKQHIENSIKLSNPSRLSPWNTLYKDDRQKQQNQNAK